MNEWIGPGNRTVNYRRKCRWATANSTTSAVMKSINRDISWCRTGLSSVAYYLGFSISKILTAGALARHHVLRHRAARISWRWQQRRLCLYANLLEGQKLHEQEGWRYCVNEVNGHWARLVLGRDDRLRADIPSRYVTSQPGQLSLASVRGRLIE